MTKEEIKFLEESNEIEGVYDTDSLKQAQTAWKYLMKQKVLNIDVILKTHKIISLHSNLMFHEKGYFRQVPIWVGGREGAPYKLIGPLMWKWTFESMRASPPLNEEEIKHLHIEYEKIHPFVDFNGRTGRMFLNYQRIKRAKLPILIIKADERQEYYKWFK